MLGLDAKSLSIPDYEITARLERLLTVVQPPLAIPVVPVTSSTTTTTNQLYDSNHHHHHHRHQNSHSAHPRHRSPSPATYRTDGNHRARSHSPLHAGIDPRTY